MTECHPPSLVVCSFFLKTFRFSHCGRCSLLNSCASRHLCWIQLTKPRVSLCGMSFSFDLKSTRIQHVPSRHHLSQLCFHNLMTWPRMFVSWQMRCMIWTTSSIRCYAWRFTYHLALPWCQKAYLKSIRLELNIKRRVRSLNAECYREMKDQPQHHTNYPWCSNQNTHVKTSRLNVKAFTQYISRYDWNSWVIFIKILRAQKPLCAKACLPIAGVTYTFRTQRCTIIQPVEGWRVVGTSCPSAFFGFIFGNYCYKSVDTEITYNAGLVLISYTHRRDRTSAASHGRSSKQHFIIRVTALFSIYH